MIGLGINIWQGRASGEPGPAPWSPSDLGEKLLAWWDAEAASSLTLTGSNVTTWTDKVSGYAPTQSLSGRKPVYSPTGFDGRRPGVTFDGADDGLGLTESPFPVGAGACEIWALVDQQAPVGDTTFRRIFAYGPSNNASRQLAHLGTASATRATGRVGSGTAFLTAYQSPFSGVSTVRMAVGAEAFSVAVDGSSSGDTPAVPDTGDTYLGIGIGLSTLSGPWMGSINAILVTTPLTEAEALQLTDYLDNRKG